MQSRVNHKEFGKSSTDETIHLFKLLDKLFTEAEELADELGGHEDVSVVCWCPLYELEFYQSLGLFFHSTGLIDTLKKIAESDNPQAATLEFAENFEPPDNIEERMTDQDKVNFAASIMCTFQNLSAISRYNKSINNLLEEARNGEDHALFNAIDVDPSVVSTETAAKRISQAVVQQDKAFLDQLGRAVKGGYPRKKPDPQYDPLRLLGLLPVWWTL